MRIALCLAFSIACASKPPPPPTGVASIDGNPSQLDQDACMASADHHPQYMLFNGKAVFTKCQPGKLTNCSKPALNCDLPDPKCGAVGMRVQWGDSCHGGCVMPEACDPSR